MRYLILMVTIFVLIFVLGCSNFDSSDIPTTKWSNYEGQFRIDGYFLPQNSPSDDFLIFYENGFILECSILDTNKFFEKDYNLDCPDISSNTRMKYQTYYGFYRIGQDTIIYLNFELNGDLSEQRFRIKDDTTLVAYIKYIRKNNRKSKIKSVTEIKKEYKFYPCANKPDSTNYHSNYIFYFPKEESL